MENLFKNCDAIIITTPSNLFYFSGYTNADCRIILTPTKKYYITDKRSLEDARSRLTDFVLIDTGSNQYNYTALGIVNSLKVEKLGYEHNNILYTDFLQIKDYLNSMATLVDISEDISAVRAVKSDCEIEKIKKAQAITDKVFTDMLHYIKAGQTELQVASHLDSLIFTYGGTLAFDTIVAFGVNTAKPHAHPTANILQKNDIITMDFGAKYCGYCSDMTRSFAIGKVTEEYKTLYNTVLEAQNLAIKNIKAGMTGIECDGISRDYFAKKGVDKYFTHSLGHSLGVDIHESPNLNPSNDQPIPLNAVTSVEPGLYIDGKMGVRIEDIVVFKNSNVENLTNSVKQLIIIG